jgi:hypothetical protein
VATDTRGRVEEVGDDCWNTWRRKDAERTIEVAWQACRSVSRRWRPGLVPRTVGRCLTPQALEVRRRCPATRGCVTWVTTKHHAWVPSVIPDEATRQPSVSEDGSAISRAVVVVNAPPALRDELVREHAEVRTRVVLEPALASLVGDEGQPVAVVQSWWQRCVRLWCNGCGVGRARSEVCDVMAAACSNHDVVITSRSPLGGR